MVVALSLGLAFGATAKVGMQNAAISTDGLNLTIESSKDVHGIQFDLKYDPSELVFNGATSLLDGFTFEYKNDSDVGKVRGLMFSMQGTKINMDNITEVIEFDFQGQGTVSFDEVILAGTQGQRIDDVTFTSFDVNTTPQATELKASYPNPFNPSTTINYDLAADGDVSIVIYDALGREVTTLLDGAQVAGTNHQITWNASEQASGAYFLRMTSGNYTNTQKLMLVK